MNSKANKTYGLITLIIMAVLLMFNAPVASAHDALIDSNPKEGETLTENITNISLVFNNPPQPVGVEAILTDATGATTPLEDYQISGNTLDLDVPHNIGGELKLSWRVVSSDGHAISGELNFTTPELVVESPSPNPTEETQKTSETASVETSTPPTPSPSQETSNDPENEGLPWTGIIIGGVLALSGVVAVVITDFSKRAKAARNARNGR